MNDVAQLERSIDAVGRDRVFKMARKMGWTAAEPPPLHVWWTIVNDLKYAPLGWGGDD